MPHILHDISVWWWARSTANKLASESRLEIVWPVSCRRHHGICGPAWLIELQRPGVYWLNSYRLELDYLLAHTPAASAE